MYDFSYIDDKIIGGVERNLPAVADIVKSIEKRATGKVTSALSATSSQMDNTQGGATATMNDTQMSGHETRTTEFASEGGEEHK